MPFRMTVILSFLEFREFMISAVLMASITHFGNYNIRQIKEYLRDRGIPMNL